MISTTSEYALRALVALTSGGTDKTRRASELATETNVPQSYLSKILTALRRAGLLEGSRGIGGGYVLARDPVDIRLIDVVELFEVVRREDACLLGRTEGCDERNPCSAHEAWKNVRKCHEEFLTTTTVADLATTTARDRRDL